MTPATLSAITILYCFAVASHALALGIGLRILSRFEPAFQQSRPHHLLTSGVEQKYWTIALSTVTNVLEIGALVPYIQSGIGYLPAGHEAVFATFHALTGLTVILWHSLTYREMLRLEREGRCGNG